MIGIILAGGRASRLEGGDKTLRRIGDEPILTRVIDALRPQCERIIINANGDPARFSAFGLRVVADTLPDQPGPLAGLLAGLEHVTDHHRDADLVLTVPGDAPFLPPDLVTRLEHRHEEVRAPIVHARSGSRDHPVVAIWSVALRDDLRRALVEEGLRKVGAFAKRHAAASVTWAVEPIDPFLNVNTSVDLAAAEVAAAVLAARGEVPMKLKSTVGAHCLPFGKGDRVRPD